MVGVEGEGEAKIYYYIPTMYNTTRKKSVLDASKQEQTSQSFLQTKLVRGKIEGKNWLL